MRAVDSCVPTWARPSAGSRASRVGPVPPTIAPGRALDSAHAPRRFLCAHVNGDSFASVHVGGRFVRERPRGRRCTAPHVGVESMRCAGGGDPLPALATASAPSALLRLHQPLTATRGDDRVWCARPPRRRSSPGFGEVKRGSDLLRAAVRDLVVLALVARGEAPALARAQGGSCDERVRQRRPAATTGCDDRLRRPDATTGCDDQLRSRRRLR